jgi:hypothetical protein
MRRAVGVILVLLGSLCLGIGLLARPYLYDRLAVAPLDQRSTSVSQGTDMDVLYAHVVDGAPVIDRLTGVRVVSTRQVVGIPGVVKKAGVEDTDAFWQTTVKSQAEVDGAMVDLTYSDAGVSLDRRSGESTNCCKDYVSTGDLDDPSSQKPVTHEGLVFKFPFGVRRTTYAWWDDRVQRAVPIRFKGEDDINGTPVYVFEQTIAPEAVSAVEAPASLFETGAEGTVTATEMYANTRTLWVEPVTGVVLDGREQVDTVYTADGQQPVPKTVGTIGFDQKTVAANAGKWGPKARVLSFVDTWLTPLGLVVGALLLGAGAWLLLRRPDVVAAEEPVEDLDGLLETRSARHG